MSPTKHKGSPHAVFARPEKTNRHLLRGGKKPREILTFPELEFCGFRAQGMAWLDCGRWAGIAEGTVYQLSRRPLVIAKIEELSKAFEQDIIARNKKRADDLATFVHAEYRHRMRNMKTHGFKGDDSIVKLLDSGLKAIGAIQPTKIVTSASANATAQATSAFEVYQSKWLAEKQKQMAVQLEQKYQNVLPPASS